MFLFNKLFCSAGFKPMTPVVTSRGMDHYTTVKRQGLNSCLQHRSFHLKNTKDGISPMLNLVNIPAIAGGKAQKIPRYSWEKPVL